MRIWCSMFWSMILFHNIEFCQRKGKKNFLSNSKYFINIAKWRKANYLKFYWVTRLLDFWDLLEGKLSRSTEKVRLLELIQPIELLSEEISEFLYAFVWLFRLYHVYFFWLAFKSALINTFSPPIPVLDPPLALVPAVKTNSLFFSSNS